MICTWKAKKHGFVSLYVPPCLSLSLSYFLHEESPRANGQGGAVSAGSRQGWGNGWTSTGFWVGGEDKDRGWGQSTLQAVRCPGPSVGGRAGRAGPPPLELYPPPCSEPASQSALRAHLVRTQRHLVTGEELLGGLGRGWFHDPPAEKSQQHGPSGLRTRTSPAQPEPGLPSVQPPDAPWRLWPELVQGGEEAGAGRWALPGACGCFLPLPPSPPPGLPDLLRLRLLQGSGPRPRLRPQPLGPRGR